MSGICVQVYENPQTGGGFSYWQAVLNALDHALLRNKYQIIVISDKEVWKEEAQKHGFEFFNLNTRICRWRRWLNKICYFLFSEKLYKRIARRCIPLFKILCEYEVKVCLGSSFGYDFRYLKLPYICPIWDLMHIYEPDFAEVGQEEEKKSRDTFFLNICRGSRIVLADSEIGKQQIIESYGQAVNNLEQKVKVLPYIPAEYIYRGKGSDDESFIPYDKYIFYPAQFWTHKNHVNLIKAISLLKSQGMEVNLICVGSEKNNRDYVQEMIQKEGLTRQVAILGFVSDEEIVTLYCHARALVMPTFFGPTNIPPLEAFVLGCPVAVSNVYGMPEQVGDAALTFNPDSVQEIAESIRRLWIDDVLCSELIQKGYERSKMWGREEFAQVLADYIEEIIGEQKSGSIS